MSQIAVLIPIYNVNQFLKKCISSILVQSFNDFELVLVDDGSTDYCGEICDENGFLKDNIITIHQNNGGRSSARNTALIWSLSCSDSKWITFIDGDDSVHRDYLKILYETIKKTRTNVSIAGLSEVVGDTIERPIEKYDVILMTPDNAYETFANNAFGINIISPCAKLYKRDLLFDIQYPIGKIYEDRFTTHKILFKNTMLSIAETQIYYYYQNPNSIMHAKWTPKALDDFEALDQQLEYFTEKKAKKAFKNTIGDYFIVLCRQIRQLRKENKTEYKYYERKLVKKLRQLFFKYAVKYKISFSRNYDVYEVAFPVFTKWFCRFKNLPNKIFKKYE